MRIDAVELRVLALPMRTPFRAAHGTVDRRDLVLVRVAGPDGEGWGECAALPEPSYSAEHVAGALLVLREHLAPRLLAAPDVSATEVADLLAAVIGHPMAKAALELAVLDAEGHRDATPLARRLCPGPPTPDVAAGAAVGLHATPRALAAEVVGLVEQGYGRLKVKVAPGRDEAHLRAVRSAVGDDVELVVDANGAYRIDGPAGDPDDARRLGWLDDFGIGHVEQPLPADALLDHAELARRLATPICLDESLTSWRTTRDAIALGACGVVCVKAPRLGSWLQAAAVLDLCLAEDVPAWVGGMLDGGVGRAANLALAAHPGATVTGDLPGPHRYFTDDHLVEHVASPPSGTPLRWPVPTAPLGAPDGEALTRLTRHVETVVRSG